MGNVREPAMFEDLPAGDYLYYFVDQENYPILKSEGELVEVQALNSPSALSPYEWPSESQGSAIEFHNTLYEHGSRFENAFRHKNMVPLWYDNSKLELLREGMKVLQEQTFPVELEPTSDINYDSCIIIEPESLSATRRIHITDHFRLSRAAVAYIAKSIPSLNVDKRTFRSELRAYWREAVETDKNALCEDVYDFVNRESTVRIPRLWTSDRIKQSRCYAISQGDGLDFLD